MADSIDAGKTAAGPRDKPADTAAGPSFSRFLNVFNGFMDFLGRLLDNLGDRVVVVVVDERKIVGKRVKVEGVGSSFCGYLNWFFGGFVAVVVVEGEKVEGVCKLLPLEAPTFK